jgi:uncharacterized membrane protein
MSFLKTFGIVFAVALVLDYIWLAKVATGFYRAQLGDLVRRGADGSMQPILWAAGIVYVLIPLGVVLFALPKVEAGAPIWVALGWGFVFGVILYGVYDFTNLALIRDWPIAMTLVDIAWGGVLCAVLTLVAVKVS